MSTDKAPPPEPAESEERWRLFTDMILPAIKAARQHVGMTEATFRTQTFHSLPRPFFLWTALDEVLKTGMFLMKLDGFLGEQGLERPHPDEADPTHRAVEAVLLEEERLRARRLCELLVQVVLFAQKDAPELYKHFLLLEDLASAVGHNTDLAQFHGVPSEWVKSAIDMTLSELHALEPGIDANDAWYAGRHARPVRAEEWRTFLSSARQRLIRALPLMTDFERLALGTTYAEAFGAPSGTIHYRAGADPVDHSSESTIVAEGTKLSLIALCIMRRIHDLLGRPPVPQLEQIARVLDSNQEPTRLLQSLNFRSIVAAGDFVVARGYFGQVVEERVSSFGYRSVRVDLLAERPLPQLAADWFRVRDVVRVFSREKLVAGVRATLGDPAAVVDDETLRRAALSAWEAGLRDEIRSRAGTRHV
jgi:hypothetical protein